MNYAGLRLSDADIAQVGRLREAGLTWTELAAHFNTTVYLVRSAFDPSYVEERRWQNRQARAVTRAVSREQLLEAKPPLIEEDQLLARLRAGLR